VGNILKFIRKPRAIIDYWYCPYCGYRILDFQYRLIKCNIECECKKGITHLDYNAIFKPTTNQKRQCLTT
jgi:hypothetical protein